MIIKSILAGSMVAVKAVSAFNITNSPKILPNGYTEVPFSMTGSIEPGGEAMTFTGPVNAVFDQIQKIKPGFTWKDFQSNVTVPSSDKTLSEPSKTIVKQLCNIPNFDHANRFETLYGYDHLSLIDANCHVDAGPRKCSQVFCRTGSKIWMCNDNDTPLDFPCTKVAWPVLLFIGNMDCVENGWLGPATWTQGQAFDDARWNVIVGSDGKDADC